MALISIKDLTFSYEGTYKNIFEHVNLNIDTSWRLALIGRNGRGKTTFLKILTKELSHKGTVTAKTDFTYFPFEIHIEDVTVRELAENICPNIETWQLEREFNLMNLREDISGRIFSTLSGGEKTKALLAMLFLKEGDFLLIDEPTNYLDISSRKTVGEYLKRKRGFILASHDRALIDACCDHVLSINKSDIELTSGNFSVWKQNAENKEKFEAKQNEKLEKEIDKLTKAAKQSAGWANKIEDTKYATKISGLRPDRGHIGAQSAKLMQQKKNAENRISRNIEEKTSLLKNLERADELKIRHEKHPSRKLVEFSHVSIYYDDTPVCTDICFTLYTGERLAVSGINGSGKSSILKIICKENIKYRGNVYIAPNLKISYVTQDASALSGKAADMAKKRGLNEAVFMAMLSKLDFSKDDMQKDATDMSMGQKKKMLLAASISENAHLYVWDEPLNYVDIISRMQIENVILRDDPSMIFTEHDRAFCIAAATNAYEINISN